MKKSNIIISIYTGLILTGTLILFILNKGKIGEKEYYYEYLSETVPAEEIGVEPVVGKEIPLTHFKVLVKENGSTTKLIVGDKNYLYFPDENNYVPENFRIANDTLFVNDLSNYTVNIYCSGLETIILKSGYLLVTNDRKTDNMESIYMDLKNGSDLVLEEINVNDVHIHANNSSVLLSNCNINRIRANMNGSHLTSTRVIKDAVFNTDEYSTYKTGSR